MNSFAEYEQALKDAQESIKIDLELVVQLVVTFKKGELYLEFGMDFR